MASGILGQEIESGKEDLKTRFHFPPRMTFFLIPVIPSVNEKPDDCYQCD